MAAAQITPAGATTASESVKTMHAYGERPFRSWTRKGKHLWPTVVGPVVVVWVEHVTTGFERRFNTQIGHGTQTPLHSQSRTETSHRTFDPTQQSAAHSRHGGSPDVFSPIIESVFPPFRDPFSGMATQTAVRTGRRGRRAGPRGDLQETQALTAAAYGHGRCRCLVCNKPACRKSAPWMIAEGADPQNT